MPRELGLTAGGGEFDATGPGMTFVFTDLEGSSRLWERHPEAMQEALASHDALLRNAMESQGGSSSRRRVTACSLRSMTLELPLPGQWRRNVRSAPSRGPRPARSAFASAFTTVWRSGGVATTTARTSTTRLASLPSHRRADRRVRSRRDDRQRATSRRVCTSRSGAAPASRPGRFQARLPSRGSRPRERVPDVALVEPAARRSSHSCCRRSSVAIPRSRRTSRLSATSAS